MAGGTFGISWGFSGAGDLFSGKASRCHLLAPGEATSRPGRVRLAKLHPPMIDLSLCRVKGGVEGACGALSQGQGWSALRKGRRQSAHGERPAIRTLVWIPVSG